MPSYSSAPSTRTDTRSDQFSVIHSARPRASCRTTYAPGSSGSGRPPSETCSSTGRASTGRGVSARCVSSGVKALNTWSGSPDAPSSTVRPRMDSERPVTLTGT